MTAVPRIFATRIAPLGILAAAFGVGMAVVVTVIVLALGQPEVGVSFSISPDGGRVVMDGEKTVTGIASDVDAMELLPLDLTVEPDGSMGDYRTYGRFLERQDRLAGIQRAGSFRVEIAGGEPVEIRSGGEGRPLTSLPAGFWIQVGVGLVSFLISASVFAFRSRSPAAWYLLLSGVATLVFAPAAALYSTRELALPGTLFRWANDLNFLGGSLFAASFVALLLHYPRKLGPSWAGLAIVGLFVAWFVAQQTGAFESMTFARRFLVLIAVFSTFLLAGVHWIMTRRDPLGRASLKWFLLSWILGTGLFAVCILLPQLFGIDTSHLQGYAFLLFILVYAGLAFGILRYRLFDLGAWWRSVLVWGAVISLLVSVYLGLVVGLRLAPGLALALALLFGVVFWLSFRTWLWGLVISRRDVRREDLFASVLRVALGQPGNRKRNGKRCLAVFLSRWR